MPSKSEVATKQSYWNGHLRRFKKSGLSRAAYCREHDVNYDQLGYYLKKADEAAGTEVPANTSNRINATIGDFIPVQVTSAAHAMAEFTLSLPDGAELRWAAYWGPKQVIEFIEQWRATPQ